MNNDSSNGLAKTGGILVVLAVVFVGGWYAWDAKMARDAANALAAQSAAVPKEQPVTQGGVQVSAPAPVNTTAKQDTSDQSIDSDVTAIDVQMSALGADTAKVDASQSDQPVPIAE